MWQQIAPGFLITLVMTVLTGLIYPLAVTAVSQALFTEKANGSMIRVNGKIVGSELIGQNFKSPQYLQPRPSAAGSDGYDAGASSGSNLGPTNKKLIGRVAASIETFRKDNPGSEEPLPSDLVTASGSGLDPHVSPASAEIQITRIAKARGIEASQVRRVIASNTEGRGLGFLGEPAVNVLKTNIALDQQFPARK